MYTERDMIKLTLFPAEQYEYKREFRDEMELGYSFTPDQPGIQYAEEATTNQSEVPHRKPI